MERRGRLRGDAPLVQIRGNPSNLSMLHHADLRSRFRVAVFVAAAQPWAMVIAQESSGPENSDSRRIAGICHAIRSWTKDFYRRALRLDGVVSLGATTGFEYARIGRAHRLFGHRRNLRCSHFTALQCLIAAAETHPGKTVATALLPLAASGYDHDMYRDEMLLVREAAHSALLRMDDPAVWKLVMRVAANPDPEETVLRIAGLRLLGMKRLPGFRGPAEQALTATRPQVRLTAAEALGHIRDPASLPRLVATIGSERHPIVSLAVLDAADRILQHHRAKLVEADWAPVVDACLGSLGRAGWRHDLATVRLVRRYPRRAAVPTLIKLLRVDAQAKTDDPMLKLVNRDTSPLVAYEAWLSLRRLTGALLPRDPDSWTAFWAKEKANVVMAPPIEDAAVRGSTRAASGFFGIPVQGRDVIFVIDTSRSMRDAIDRVAARGQAAQIVKRTRRSRTDKGEWTRLDAAKEQILIAVSGMSPTSHYRILTFADDVHVWNEKPVRARRFTLTALMKTFDRIRPFGFTNTFAAISQILHEARVNLRKGTEDRLDEVFFLSDGEPTAGAIQDETKLLAYVKKLNRYRQVRINTVFTGSGDGAEFMRKLAEQNHGIFVHYGQ